ncbi:MAG: LamG domain-containing protein [Armatimonadia bacterium]
MRSNRVLIVLCVLWCGAACAVEPLAYWPMETIANGVVADASGNGHEAVASGLDGKLPEVVPGVIGNCLRFTGASQQYLEVKQAEQLRAPAAMTVMAWIKPAAGGATYEIISDKGDKSGDGPWPGWRLRYFWSRAMFQFGAADSTEPTVSSPEWSVPAGFWSHVALTYDGHRLTLYLDCELAAEQDLTVPIMAAKRTMTIGNYIGRKNAYAFDGLMDEVKVFGAVLGAEDIYTEAAKGMAQ